MKIKNKSIFGLIMMIALILGFAQVSASADETAEDSKKAKPERPDRPEKPSDSNRPSAAELKEIIKNFQAQKTAYLKQQKEQRADARNAVREGLGASGTVVAQEAKDAVADAKRVSREQARKIADEAKEAAKEDRRRD